jgi:hypothetical protein
MLDDRVRGGVILRVWIERQDIVLRGPSKGHRIYGKTDGYQRCEEKPSHLIPLI